MKFLFVSCILSSLKTFLLFRDYFLDSCNVHPKFWHPSKSIRSSNVSFLNPRSNRINYLKDNTGSSFSLMKMLNSVWLLYWSLGLTTGTGLQRDFMLLFTTLWAQQFHQFSVFLSSLYSISLSVRMLCDKVSKVLLKARQTISPAASTSHCRRLLCWSGMTSPLRNQCWLLPITFCP